MEKYCLFILIEKSLRRLDKTFELVEKKGCVSMGWLLNENVRLYQLLHDGKKDFSSSLTEDERVFLYELYNFTEVIFQNLSFSFGCNSTQGFFERVKADSVPNDYLKKLIGIQARQDDKEMIEYVERCSELKEMESLFG